MSRRRRPGSIHEGGELGYSLSHAYGAALDNPDLIVACVVGDGEAETGPLATAWHSNKFINPVRDGAVLPILNLNGYKIANPTILARISHEELEALFVGYGYKPYFVEGSRSCRDASEDGRHARRRHRRDPRDPEEGARERQGRAAALADDRAAHAQGLDRAEGDQAATRSRARGARTRCLSPTSASNPANLQLLESWLRSYKPEELFDADGRLLPELQALAPEGTRRMSANPHANGGVLRRAMKLPDFRDYAVEVPQAGRVLHENTRPLGEFLRDAMRDNMTTFRVFGPDETASNRLQSIYEVSKKIWLADLLPEDADGGELSRDGRVMEMLSEHTLVGWLEGYLLSGRHGFFHTYEAFAHVVDSMFNQHAKWLDICKNHVPWRASVSSQNILLSSTVWRQDHNGFSHQDPGFIDLVTNKSPCVTRVYLPPDANTLLVVADQCLRSTDCINVIVADKQKHLQFTTMDEAIVHCAKGIGIWAAASNDEGEEPDVVMASCGDVATQEALAATAILRERSARTEAALRECRGPVQDAARERAPARLDRARVRQPLHGGQAGDLQLPRLPVADPQARLSLPQPREPARARLQGEGQHQHAARARDPQSGRPLQSGDRCARPRAATAAAEPRISRKT